MQVFSRHLHQRSLPGTGSREKFQCNHLIGQFKSMKRVIGYGSKIFADFSHIYLHDLVFAW